jgi:magnesium-transporting ATPase (P-type)
VLNEKREERVIKVIRDGEEQMIDIHSVVVGDVVLFEPGKIIPCDGIFLSGHNVRCDESGATGESDAITKLSYHQCIALRERQLAEFDPDTDGTPGDGESTSGSRMKVDSGLVYLVIQTALSLVEVRLSKGLVYIWSSLSVKNVSTGYVVCPSYIYVL